MTRTKRPAPEPTAAPAPAHRAPAAATTLTPPQLRALTALRDISDKPRGSAGRPRGSASPREIAHELWPDSPGWTRVSKRGATAAGGALGATMPMKAATLLWRLDAAGVGESPAIDSNAWTITQRGRDLLDAQPPAKRPLLKHPFPSKDLENLPLELLTIGLARGTLLHLVSVERERERTLCGHAHGGNPRHIKIGADRLGPAENVTCPKCFAAAMAWDD